MPYKLRPSSAKVWLNCPKAPKMITLAPPIETPATERGTLLHLIGAQYVRDLFSIPQLALDYECSDVSDPIAYANYCYDLVTDVFGNDLSQVNVLVEEKIPLTGVTPDGNGIIDFGAIGNDTAIIIDYKSGFFPVFARDNPQLYLYALALDRVLLEQNGRIIEHYYLAISQPSRDNFSVVHLTRNELEAWLASNEDKIKKASEADGDFVVGEHCKMCSGRGFCRAYMKYTLQSGGDENEEYSDD